MVQIEAQNTLKCQGTLSDKVLKSLNESVGVPNLISGLVPVDCNKGMNGSLSHDLNNYEYIFSIGSYQDRSIKKISTPSENIVFIKL